MKIKMFAIVVAVAVGGAVVAGDTQSFFDKQYDFTQLETWDFKAQRRISRDPLADNELWARMIREEIATQLQKYRFERTTESPDFLVAFYVGLKDRYTVQSMDYGFPGLRPRRLFRWPWGWPAAVDIWRIPYTDSTLIIDMIDADSNMLVWRGYDTRTIDMDKPDKALDKGVNKVLKRFLEDIGRLTD
jgi:hypothetical protein